MASWSLTGEKVQKAATMLAESSSKINEKLKTYQAVRTALLNSWEGSHKDEFKTRTDNKFEIAAQELSKKAGALSQSTADTKKKMFDADEKAAQILRGK